MRVLLPAQTQSPAKLTLLASAAPEPERSGHVLVVDDQEMVRGLLAQMLKKLGYSVTLVASGDEAMSALEHAAADASCVLLDLTMPGEDGGQAFARIRARYAQLPIVFMSGYEPQSVPKADGFLHKPFTLNDLRRALSEVVAAQPRSKG